MMGPKQASDRLHRLASAVESARSPSLSKVAQEIGKVLVALEEEGLDDVPTTSPEGQLAVPAGQIISHLNGWLTAKYRIEASYRSYADRVRGPWRDALVGHWYEHADEERKQSYALAMKIVGLGGEPMPAPISIPECPTNLMAFCSVLMSLEVAAIESARKTIEMAGSMDPLRVLAEEIMLKDAHHLDDLRRICTGYGTTPV